MNRNKNLLVVGLSALCFAFIPLFTGCGSPAQNIATGTFLGGNGFATYELDSNPLSLKGLQDFAEALPLIPLGKVTPFQMGVLNAEIEPLKAAAAVDTKNAAVYNQIGSLISAASQANAGATGGNPTVNTGIAIAALTDFANGINHGIQFWQGQQSTIAPITK
jgi:hypothetical protein